MNVSIKGLALAALMTVGLAAGQAPAPPPMHARTAHRLVIKNAMVIYGNAKPPYGPVDIVVQDGLISYIGPADAAPGSSVTVPTTPRSSDTVIDATGKYVMPGIVNAHMHWHEERQPGMPQPIQYERNLYLAAGVTTARDVGSDFDKSKRWQAESNAHTIISPRILVYPFVSKGRTGAPAEIRAWIRDIKQRGADGLKITGDLTIHGVTKPVVLSGKVNKIGDSPMGKGPSAGFEADATLKRSDFGIAKLVPSVGDEIKVHITLDSHLAKS